METTRDHESPGSICCTDGVMLCNILVLVSCISPFSFILNFCFHPGITEPIVYCSSPTDTEKLFRGEEICPFREPLGPLQRVRQQLGVPNGLTNSNEEEWREVHVTIIHISCIVRIQSTLSILIIFQLWKLKKNFSINILLYIWLVMSGRYVEWLTPFCWTMKKSGGLRNFIIKLQWTLLIISKIIWTTTLR